MDNRLLFLIIFLISSPFLLALVHSLVIRLCVSLKKEISMQKVLLYCILFLNPPVLFISLAILDAGYNNILDYIYIFMTFNFLAYIYFHFFNMSETSRRIKILIGIRKGKIKNINDIKSYYDYDRSLLIRLKRLEEMSQVRIINSDSYILQGRLLYTVSCIVFFFRMMLGFGNTKKVF